MKQEFTSEDFKAMKKALGLTNKDVADIIGVGEPNVRRQTSPNKPLATWAKSMLFVFNLLTEKEAKNIEIIDYDLLKDPKKVLEIHNKSMKALFKNIIDSRVELKQ